MDSGLMNSGPQLWTTALWTAVLSTAALWTAELWTTALWALELWKVAHNYVLNGIYHISIPMKLYIFY